MKSMKHVFGNVQGHTYEQRQQRSAEFLRKAAHLEHDEREEEEKESTSAYRCRCIRLRQPKVEIIQVILNHTRTKEDTQVELKHRRSSTKTRKLQLSAELKSDPAGNRCAHTPKVSFIFSSPRFFPLALILGSLSCPTKGYKIGGIYACVVITDTTCFHVYSKMTANT